MKKNGCPSSDEIYNYLSLKLTEKEEDEIEEHLSFCDKCIKEARKYHESFFTLESFLDQPAAHHGRAWEAEYGDVIVAAAAAALGQREVVELTSELTSKDGKKIEYKISLHPSLEKENEYLLVVELLQDESIQGKVIIRDKEKILLKAPITQGRASGKVTGPIDLSLLVITVQTQ